jgi:tRNA modification GTPase
MAPAISESPDVQFPTFTDSRLRISANLELPATVFRFRAPHSFTGQDVVEMHTVGALPALRELSARLIEMGARRALPGEFTARAYMNGRMSGDQVDGVLRLISASDLIAARQAARLARGGREESVQHISDRLVDLLSSVEAGVDFVEEEDVTFITAEELAAALGDLIRQLETLASAGAGDWRRGKPHVALAGLPNAGKSTLFNALTETDRAIVSPIIGTTRDVLTAEIDVGGISIVLQDSAGLGNAVDDLESAAHLAAELAADQADLVLWVHDTATPWRPQEAKACERIPAGRRFLILSKCDRPTDRINAPRGAFVSTLNVSAATGSGIDALRDKLTRTLSETPASPGLEIDSQRLPPALDSLRRARESVHSPEIAALEMRTCWESLNSVNETPLVEDILGKIMARFCIGK